MIIAGGFFFKPITEGNCVYCSKSNRQKTCKCQFCSVYLYSITFLTLNSTIAIMLVLSYREKVLTNLLHHHRLGIYMLPVHAFMEQHGLCSTYNPPRLLRFYLNWNKIYAGESQQLAKIRVFKVDYFDFSCKKLKNQHGLDFRIIACKCQVFGIFLFFSDFFR